MLNVTGSVVPFSYTDPRHAETAGWGYFGKDLGPPKGLIVMCHGNSKDDATTLYKSCWDYLAKPLALSGFIVISVRHAEKGADAAADHFINNILFFMKNAGDWFGLLGKPLALVGNSEGGGGALRAGRRIQQSMEAAPYFTKVKAIVTLAPNSNLEPGNCAESTLIVQGTHDNDQPCGGKSLSQYFAISVPEKYFIWFHRCNHQAFIEHGMAGDADPVAGTTCFDVFDPSDPPRVTGKTQRLATMNYTARFIIWRFSSNPESLVYKNLFRSRAVIKWDSQKVNDSIAFDEITNKFRAFPRYDLQSGWLPIFPLIPPPAIFSGFSKVSVYKSLSLLHATLAYEQETGWDLSWELPPSASIRFQCKSSVMQFATKLEFHAIQIANSILNNVGAKPLIGSAKLVYGDDKSSKDVLFQIEPSLNMVTKTKLENVPAPTMARSMLSTVSIAMSEFMLTPDERATIKDVVLTFNAPTKGRIALTRLRVTYQ